MRHVMMPVFDRPEFERWFLLGDWAMAVLPEITPLQGQLRGRTTCTDRARTIAEKRHSFDQPVFHQLLTRRFWLLGWSPSLPARTLLGAPGRTTRSKEALRLEPIASRLFSFSASLAFGETNG